MPVTEASAETTVASASTPEQTPTKVEFNGWDDKGTPIRIDSPKTSDSATDKKNQQDPTHADSSTASTQEPRKDKTKPDSSTGKDKTADTASDSATDTEQKRRQRTSEDTERRITDLLDELKTVRRERDELKTKPSDTRDGKQASQPAAEAKLPSLREFLDDYFVKPENKGKKYEDGVESWQAQRESAITKNLNAQVRQQIANEAAARDLSTRVEEIKTRYPDFEQRIQPAVKAITDDQSIPFPVKAVLNDSPVFVDLMYVLAEPKALADLIQTARTNPAAAIRKIVLTEQLIQTELAKGKPSADGADKTANGGEGRQRDDSGKFTSSDSSEKTAASETKPRAPKPPSEVGGRGTATTSEEAAAAQANDFRALDAAMSRRFAAQHKKG